MMVDPGALGMLTFALAAGGGGALAAALVNAGASVRRTRENRRGRLAHLGLRVAVQLERFSQACYSAIHECEVFEETGGAIGRRGRRLPELAEYPDGEGWLDLEPELADRLLTFRNALATANLRVRAATHDDVEAGQSIFVEECGVCGADAWDLAQSVRRRCGLKLYSPPYDFPRMLTQRALLARATGEIKEGGPASVLTLPSVLRKRPAETDREPANTVPFRPRDEGAPQPAESVETPLVREASGS